MFGSNKSIHLDQKVVLVTGASSGIGRALCLELAHRKATVVAISRNTVRLEDLTSEIRSYGGEIEIFPADVRSLEQAEKTIHEVIKKFNRIDVLVANAGQYIRGRLKDTSIEQYRSSMEVNFFGALNYVKPVWNQMTLQRQGRIIFINSLDAEKAIVNDGPYAAAKFALAGLADALRQEGKEVGIRVTSIFPSRVDTPMLANIRTPWISSKLPVKSVISAVIRSLSGRKAQVTIPKMFASIVVLNTFFPHFVDWAYKMLEIEGYPD